MPSFTLEYPSFTNTLTRKTCVLMDNSLEYDLFIRPSEERLLTDDEIAQINAQWANTQGGKTLEDAYYYLA